MKIENLVAFLSGTYDLEALREEIASEVKYATQQNKVQGSSAPICVEGEYGDSFRIGPDEVRRLCSAFADGQISAEELSYISDAMQLSESIDWSDETLFDMVFVMSDPEINGQFTPETANDFISRLGPPNPSFNPDAASARHRPSSRAATGSAG